MIFFTTTKILTINVNLSPNHGSTIGRTTEELIKLSLMKTREHEENVKQNCHVSMHACHVVNIIIMIRSGNKREKLSFPH